MYIKKIRAKSAIQLQRNRKAAAEMSAVTTVDRQQSRLLSADNRFGRKKKKTEGGFIKWEELDDRGVLVY